MATVLVVDDDDDIRELLRAAIEGTGHKVVTAPNVAGAESLLSENPDLLVADIDMPGETGVEFVMRLRQQEAWADLKVIFVTAYAERAGPLQRTGRGAQQVLHKPFRMERVREAVESALATE